MDDKETRQFEDDLLDAALAVRAKAETSAGLEQRILAGIEARAKAPLWPRWARGFAFGAVAVAVAAVAWLHRPANVAPPKAVRQASSQTELTRPATIARAQRVPPPAASARTVRPAQFPTPRPLSAQERLLLAYVRSARLGEMGSHEMPLTDEDLKIPELEIATLDVKPIEGTEESPEKQ